MFVGELSWPEPSQIPVNIQSCSWAPKNKLLGEVPTTL